MEQARYTIVRDQGDNIGLLCPVCNSARWQADHDTRDLTTQEDCKNCVLIKKTNAFEKELVKSIADKDIKPKDDYTGKGKNVKSKKN